MAGPLEARGGRGGRLHSGGEQPLADEPLEVELDLARQRQSTLGVLRPIERYPHGCLVPAIMQANTLLYSANWMARESSNCRPTPAWYDSRPREHGTPRCPRVDVEP